jgi:hypothetical protein
MLDGLPITTDKSCAGKFEKRALNKKGAPNPFFGNDCCGAEGWLIRLWPESQIQTSARERKMNITPSAVWNLHGLSTGYPQAKRTISFLICRFARYSDSKL